jgi:predicted DNA-binding transcriptional regulator AlpA
VQTNTPHDEPLLVRTTAAPAFCGLPASTFFALALRPDFPAKVRLGERTTGYVRAELRDWLLAQRDHAESAGCGTADDLRG